MKATLLGLILENFRSHKHFEAEFGQTTVVQAENGRGKTNLFHAYLWLLFGKSTDGRSDFDYRPLDENNEPIRGLDVVVGATLAVDGTPHTFKKLEKEHCSQDGKYSYPALYWVDDVPMLLKDYKQYIVENVVESEATFLQLSDLSHVLGKMHWTELRQILINIAGNVGVPAGFEDLFELCGNRSPDDMKTVLVEEKKGYGKERDEIPARIDEKQRDLTAYAQIGSEADLPHDKRKLVEESILEIIRRRTTLLGKTKQRQDRIDALNKLTCQKLHRETVLKTDTSGTEKLRNEKTTLQAAYSEQEQATAKLHGDLKLKLTSLEVASDNMDSWMRKIQEVRDEHKAAKDEPVDLTCYACGQAVPEAKKIELEARRETKLTEIILRGNKLQEGLNERNAEIETIQADMNMLETANTQAKKQLRETESASAARCIEIDTAIANRPCEKPEDDLDWQIIVSRITEAAKEIGDPVNEQLDKIEARKQAADAELKRLDDILRNADKAAEAKARIEELDARQKELAQKIADCDKWLLEITKYMRAESDLVAAAVNGRFKHVTFKLFEDLLTLEQDGKPKQRPCCVAIYKGRPYKEMSSGEQIICGVDAVNVLSTYYDVWPPLFIDHREALTLPLEAKTQTISLVAAAGIKELEITFEK